VSAPSAEVAASLTDRAALQAALGAGRPDIKSFDVAGTATLSSTSRLVEVSVETSKGSRRLAFAVERSGESRFLLYPVWRVAVTPTLIAIALPKGSTGITVDGKAIDIPAGTSNVAVLPLPHRVTLNGTQILLPETQAVD